MENIAAYRIQERITETRTSIIFRGEHPEEPGTVIIKVLKTKYPTPSEIARFKQEYRLVKDLDIDGVVRTLDLVDHEGGYAIVEEDFGGISLRDFTRAKKIGIKTFLRLAVSITRTLGALHKKNIIHRDIKPDNILINPGKGKVKISDFGIAAIVTHENDEIYSPDVIQGTLAYISPEQTGRMNRDVDYRTDLYSLGITFYEMLTGELPFRTRDPMELIHSHIARQPAAPDAVNPAIPGMISEIIMKLLAKAPEERYQNSHGLMADLNECLKRIKMTGKIDRFKLGSRDISIRFSIPHLLVGREREIETLLGAFERVANPPLYTPGSDDRHGVEIMLVEGNPGIGKSALVNEIHKPIVSKHGYFIMGKYDQFRRDVPYSSIIQAFQNLVRQLLAESEERISDWRKKILGAIEPNGAVITGVIPELELITGKQPPVPDLGPEESQNRFNLVFQNLTGVFTTREHPLVLFLDDLQWADSASLKLIRTIVTNRSTRFLFFIGAYRDTEVREHHPLMITLEEIRKKGVVVNSMALTPLAEKHVNRLISTVLRCELPDSLPLAELIHRKTNGNPFFVNQFFRTLYDRRILELDPAAGWRWDMGAIARMEVTDNVIDLLSGKIASLPENTRAIMQICACIGNRFGLQTLADVSGESVDRTLADLTPAVQEGLVNLAGDIYKFHHDRIQEAAYALVSDADKARMHYRIGMSFLEKTPEDQVADAIFYIVDQLNWGSELITLPREKVRLAKLNLTAGEKAKSANAYTSAMNYYQAAVMLLPADSWRSNYELTHTLYRGLMECEYLNLHFEEAKKLFEVIIANVQSNIDRADAYSQMVMLNTSQGNYEAAQRLGVEGMRLVGIKVPKKVSTLRLGYELLMLRRSFGSRRIEELIDQPMITDEEKHSYLHLANNTGTVVYYIDANLFAFIVVKSLTIILKYGNFEYSPFGYNALGSIVGAGLGFYKHGYRFGLLSLALMEKMKQTKERSRNEFLFSMFIQHWCKHAKYDLDYYREAYKHGIETGDLIFSGHSINLIGMTRLMLGDNIDEIWEEYQKYADFQKGGKDPFVAHNFNENSQMMRCLKGLTVPRGNLNGTAFDEDEQLQYYRREGNLLGIFYLQLVRLRINYLFGNYAACLEPVDELVKLAGEKIAIGNLHIPEANFYQSLALAAHYRSAGFMSRIRYRARLALNQLKMKNWARFCPENYLHKYLLVEAERSRLAGRHRKAEARYLQAAASARENGYTQNEGIANERAALLMLEKKESGRARQFMKDAHYCYIRWGADAKAQDLEERYADLLAERAQGDMTDDTMHTAGFSTSHSASGGTRTLDIATVLKTSQAISSEIDLGKLLEQIMKLAIENAGAEHGYLILENEKEGKLCIEAAGRIDQGVKTLGSVPVEGNRELAVSIVNYVRKTNEEITIGNAVEDRRFAGDRYIVSRKPKSIICGPIRHQGKTAGIVYLENNLITDAFTPERLQLLQMFSVQAAISIENSRLIAHRENAAKLATEMRIAANIQSALLPESPAIPGFEITAYMRPADDVGGDYYDVLNVGDHHWVFIGDVSGHGVPAGLIMMMVQTSIQAYLRRHPGTAPAELLAIVNEAIRYNVGKMKEDKYMTITAFSLREDGTAVYSGLHQDLLVFRSADGKVESLESIGIWLSPWDLGQAGIDRELRLLPGDILLLYTDGITEAKNGSGEMFGEERLAEILGKNGALSTDGISARILAELEGFQGNDDVTMLLLKKT